MGKSKPRPQERYHAHSNFVFFQIRLLLNQVFFDQFSDEMHNPVPYNFESFPPPSNIAIYRGAPATREIRPRLQITKRVRVFLFRDSYPRQPVSTQEVCLACYGGASSIAVPHRDPKSASTWQPVDFSAASYYFLSVLIGTETL